MNEFKSIISTAIEKKTTLIAEHYYCEVIKEPLTLEVYPYKIDGDFLVCYDIKGDQPYAINLNNVVKIFHSGKKNVLAPQISWLKS